jgi:NAD(P)-dependent dehydrogenase (short-subunit alcohol dehydrogenase family)
LTGIGQRILGTPPDDLLEQVRARTGLDGDGEPAGLGCCPVTGQVHSLGRRAPALEADLAEPTAAAAVVDAVVSDFGRLNILVNNAGITHWGSLAQTRLEDFERFVAVNARAPFLMMQAAVTALADGGRVVNISAGVTGTALAGIVLYSGVKAFLDQVTKVAAIELAPRGITVNAGGARQHCNPVPSRTSRPSSGPRRDPRSPSAGSESRRTPPAWSLVSPPTMPVSSLARSSTTQAASTAPSAGPNDEQLLLRNMQALLQPRVPSLPGFRFPLSCCRFSSPGGEVRPGWSSSDGGSEEFPELRDAARSSLATHSASAAFATSQLGHPRGQRHILRCHQRDQLLLQGDQRIAGSIQRLGGHKPSSGHLNCDQDDTLSWPAWASAGWQSELRPAARS